MNTDRIAGDLMKIASDINKTAARFEDVSVKMVRQISPTEFNLEVNAPAGNKKRLIAMVEAWMELNDLRERDGWVYGIDSPYRWVVYNENNSLSWE